jgi:hypothetical protein
VGTPVLRRQAVKLSGQREIFSAEHLSFSYHVHEFDASENGARTSEAFEADDRSGFSFDGSMVLLDDVVEILTLSDRHVRTILPIEVLDARLVRPAFIDVRNARKAIVFDGAREEPPCGATITFCREIPILSANLETSSNGLLSLVSMHRVCRNRRLGFSINVHHRSRCAAAACGDLKPASLRRFRGAAPHLSRHTIATEPQAIIYRKCSSYTRNNFSTLFSLENRVGL